MPCRTLSPIPEEVCLSEKTLLINKSTHEYDSPSETHVLEINFPFRRRVVKLVLYGAFIFIFLEISFIVMNWKNPSDGDPSFRILPVDPRTGYPDLPLFGRSKTWKRHRAQTIADDYRDSFHRAIASDLPVNLDDREDRASTKIPDGCEGTVVIVRHCEKASIREHCSYLGYERSVFLATLFGTRDARWPKPSYIYAESPGGRPDPKKHNYREIETVLPLADKAKVTINSSFSFTSTLAKDITDKLASGEMCGKVTVVAWKHTGIVSLANKLGCGPSQGCPFDYPGESFDQAWTIKFVYEKLWHSEHKSGKVPKYARWQVFGSVQNENFDPLHLSKEFGDYPEGGTDHGGRWRGQWADIQGRKNFEDEDIEKANPDLGPPEGNNM